MYYKIHENLPEPLQEVVRKMFDSGQSEAKIVAEHLNTLAENAQHDQEALTSTQVRASLDEMIGWAMEARKVLE